MSRSSFGKRDRDQAKKAKAKAKRERRQAAGEASAAEATSITPDDGASAAALLQQLEDVHRLHAAGGISDDDFQETKADLLARLPVD